MATIKDIAALAGVSPATVSRILNQDESLSVTDETRDKVIDAAKKLKYKKVIPQLPKNLTIGIFQWYSEIQELEDPYYQSIRIGIEKYCSSKQIDVVRVYQTDLNYKEALKSINALLCIGKFSQEKIEELESLAPHVIFLDMKMDRITHNTISLDFSQAVYDLMNYLTSLGHKDIGFLGGQEFLNDDSLYMDDRERTFIQYCTEHNINYLPYVKRREFTSDAGYAMAMELVEEGNIPSAIFAASDPIAIGAIRAFFEKGYRIPEDISIIGFDDISMASFIQPALTTVKTPAEFMGEYAAHYIHLMMMDQSTEYNIPVKLILPCELVIRESCCKHS